MGQFAQKVKRFNWAIIRPVQKVLITVLLFLTYTLGIGVLFLIAQVFVRKLLKNPPAQNDSYWMEPKGYTPDMEDCLRQS